MDPPPAPPPTSTAPPPYPDSVESSPRSRATDFDDQQLHPKLRLMCSYGGHIVPRPHDKSLCYVGGDTRMVVIDRSTSLSDLLTRLSKTTINHPRATAVHLKYQLPTEDLDSLITVSTDEDLDNLIDEYDRIFKSPLKSGRIRLFLFPTKPDVAHSVGPLLDGSNRSEDWFLNALNDASELHRGYSDPSLVNNLLGLDHDVGNDVIGNNNSFNSNHHNNDDVNSNLKEVEEKKTVVGSKSLQDVNTMPDSPIIDTTSSFGSTSSQPSFMNLPPIRVHVDQRVGGGIEEQFSQMTVGGGGGDYGMRAYLDDERSDQGLAAGGYRIQQQVQQQMGQSAVNLSLQAQQKQQQLAADVPSPDSVSSDTSLSSAIARQKSVMYQDSNGQLSSGSNRPQQQQGMQQMQQVSESGYGYHPQYEQHQQQMLQQHQHQQQQQQHQHQQQQQNLMHQQQHQQQQQGQTQQQFVQPGSNFVHHQPQESMPMPGYYPMYPPQQQQQQQNHQYPVYYVPAGQAQGYGLPPQQQRNMGEGRTSAPSNRTQIQSSTYNPNLNMNLAPTKSEMGAAVYRTNTAPSGTQQQHQQQQQFVGYSQTHHHPSQSVAPNSGGASGYTYDYADPARSQMYYTQPLSPALSSQYQGITLGGPTMMMSDGSSQLSNDIGK